MLFSAFVDLRFYFKWMLCAVALLATEIAVREASTLRSSGVYENGVVTEGEVILFKDISGAKKARKWAKYGESALWNWKSAEKGCGASPMPTKANGTPY